MAETLVLLQLEHRTFLRVLAVLDELAQELRGPTGADVELLREIFAYFLGFPDACHHPKEDAVFRRLEAVDPALAERIGNLVDDHEGLARRTAETARRVRQASGATDPVLASVLEEFADVYRDHIEREELHFLPAVRDSLTRDDWDVIDFEMFDAPDPLFDEQVEERYRQLRRAILDARPPRERGGEA